MIRLPVFGQDSVPHSSSRVLGLLATSFIWLIFLICAIYIGPKKESKVKYEVVQLTLSPDDHYIPNVTQEMIDLTGGKTGGESEIIEESSPVPVVEQPAAPAETKTVQTQKTVTQPKQDTLKTTQAPVVKQPSSVPDTSTTSSTTSSSSSYEYATSVDDMIKTQTSNVKPKDYSNVDWDAMFGDTSNAQTSQNTSNTKVQGQSGVSGAAATSSTSSNQSTSSTSSSNSSSSVNNTASSSTLDSLSQMAKSTASASSTSGSSSSNVSSSSSSRTTATGGAFEFEDGNTRSLKSELKIVFSSEAARLITENRDVVISFYIGEAGNTYNIKFSNNALIPQIVLNEIESQIKRWIFDPANNISIAKFTLKIRTQ